MLSRVELRAPVFKVANWSVSSFVYCSCVLSVDNKLFTLGHGIVTGLALLLSAVVLLYNLTV